MVQMTASQFLSRRRQRNLLWSLGGFLVCAILCFLIIDAGHPALGAGLVVIAAVAMKFTLSSARALLCPACGGDLSPVLLYRPSRKDRRPVVYCPYCGRNLDEMNAPEVAPARAQ